MTISNIFQKELTEAIRLAIAGDSLDAGKSIVYYVKYLLSDKSVVKELKLDFDHIEINPAQHNVNKADIMLYKNRKIVRRINAKTCVSGNLESTIRSLIKTKRREEDGLVIFGLICVDTQDRTRRILGTVFIDKAFLYYETLPKIIDVLVSKMKQKQEEENCKELRTYSLNQMIALEGAIGAIRAQDTAAEARDIAAEARDIAAETQKSVKMLEEKVVGIDKKIDSMNELLKKLAKERDKNT